MADEVDAGWARFWAVDLHVHTPGSDDADEQHFGSPEEIVRAAIGAGLDAIAVTDHNTARWCDRMAKAAVGTSLIVLPGFELSTRDGHLLGIWEEGTPAQDLEDVLLQLGIKREELGALDIAAAHGMGECAAKIASAGGVAIAAHIDRERGLLRQQVQTYVNELLANRDIAGFEYLHQDTPGTVKAKLKGEREPAMVRHSDSYSAALSRHDMSAIGGRRTWYKAARPDLIGIRYALEDAGLRVRTTDPSLETRHPRIDSVAISSGFLGGSAIDLSPDLNCLLGGTGAGKSLVLEAMRFALDQQVDQRLFPTIRGEVDLRLSLALGAGTLVRLIASVDGETYRISRRFSDKASVPAVEQQLGDEWVAIERGPEQVLPIAAFSQGEILEYSRQPVGRVGLVDAHLDLGEVTARIGRILADLNRNASALLDARTRVEALSEKSAKATGLQSREEELSDLFDENLVNQQRDWAAERSDLGALKKAVDEWRLELVDPPAVPTARIPEHAAEFERLKAKHTLFEAAVGRARSELDAARDALGGELTAVRAELDSAFTLFESTVQERLDQAGQRSMVTLLTELQSVQGSLNVATKAGSELVDEAAPELERLVEERDRLLGDLKDARDERRNLRRARVKELNRKTAGIVRLDVPSRSDREQFRSLLEIIKVGSHLSGTVLDAIANGIHPYSLVRAIWSGDHSKVGKLPEGVSPTDLSRLQTNVADRSLWEQLLAMQIVDLPDKLDVKFKKPEGGDYVPIEHLSHGQKCTAVLVILLADGETPVLIDQPEDALHAPWIEDYLVDRLRELRGTRQYLFATRSAGLVVSADSEQLVTMRATAERGEVEAHGSLERHDVNKLALHHLEGGRVPFGRRAQKLRTSIGA